MASKSDLFARLELNYADHPKIAVLSDAAFRAHVELILYARKYETDGIIRNQVANRMGSRWDTDVLSELQNNDTEDPSLVKLDNGDYYLHGYEDMQETKAEIAARRRKNRENGKKGGRPKGPQKTQSVSDSAHQSGTQKKAETETETDITPPSPDPFEDWWQHYPKKVNKGDARKKYAEALEKTTHQRLVEAAKGYANYCANTGREKRYIKGPARWLNVEGWDNEDELDTPRHHKPSKWDYGPEAYMHPEEVEDERRRAEANERHS